MSRSLRIGIIGDFKPQNSSHIATNEALQHAARELYISTDAQWLPTPVLEEASHTEAGLEDHLEQFDGLWCAPGSPYESMDGALEAIRFGRERDLPFVGT